MTGSGRKKAAGDRQGKSIRGRDYGRGDLPASLESEQEPETMPWCASERLSTNMAGDKHECESSRA